MTDQTTGDQPWNLPGAFAPNPPAREPRQKRKPREAAAPKKERKPRPVAERHPPGHDGRDLPAKKTRKARKEKAERAAPETIKVTMKEYAGMRVGPDDAKLFLKLHGMLSLVSKGTRAKVLGELAKVFG